MITHARARVSRAGRFILDLEDDYFPCYCTDWIPCRLSSLFAPRMNNAILVHANHIYATTSVYEDIGYTPRPIEFAAQLGADSSAHRLPV